MSKDRFLRVVKFFGGGGALSSCHVSAQLDEAPHDLSLLCDRLVEALRMNISPFNAKVCLHELSRVGTRMVDLFH